VRKNFHFILAQTLDNLIECGDLRKLDFQKKVNYFSPFSLLYLISMITFKESENNSQEYFF